MSSENRQIIKAVFGLNGGELEDGPCPAGYTYWYEGAPEYAASDYRNESRRLITVIVYETFGLIEPPEAWERLNSFASSGEAPCPWCGNGTGNEHEREGCDLCEGDGYVSLGEGWAEVLLAKRPVLHRPEEYLDGVTVRDPFTFEGQRYVLVSISRSTSYTYRFVVPEDERVDEDEYRKDEGLDWTQDHCVVETLLLQRLATHLGERLDLPYSTDVVLP